MYPLAKFSFDINANPDCVKDFVAFTTSLVGSSSSPSIVAFNQLYNGTTGGAGFCGSGGPQVIGPTTPTRRETPLERRLLPPHLSMDGSKLAFVEDSNTSRDCRSAHPALAFR